MPSNGFGDAAAKDSREDSLEYCVVALTRMSALAATSGIFLASIKYSNVESLSSTAASLTATACGGWALPLTIELTRN